MEVLVLDDIYSGINGKLCKNSRREFVQLKNIDAKFYASDYYCLGRRSKDDKRQINRLKKLWIGLGVN